MSIAQNLDFYRAELAPFGAMLVAVSKTQPIEALAEAYAAGQRDFGENRVQELMEKAPNLPGDIRWHLIGHLQTNKVKYIAPFVHLIHSVDSLKLLQEIDRQAQKVGRVIPVLLQIYLAQEETKFGLDRDEVWSLLQSEEYQAMQNIRIEGLMGMASLTDDTQQVSREFAQLATLKQELAQAFPENEYRRWQHLSMGMSGDYPMALAQGATLVRIGSALFGKRG